MEVGELLFISALCVFVFAFVQIKDYRCRRRHDRELSDKDSPNSYIRRYESALAQEMSKDEDKRNFEWIEEIKSKIKTLEKIPKDDRVTLVVSVNGTVFDTKDFR